MGGWRRGKTSRPINESYRTSRTPDSRGGFACLLGGQGAVAARLTRQHQMQQMTDASLLAAMPGESVLGGDGTRSQPASSHSRTTACPVLQMLTLPDLRDEYHPGKLATTETRQPIELGSFRMTLAFGASGPERVTTFAPTRTATAVAGTARPFTIVSGVAERGVSRRPAGGPLRGGDVGAGEAIGALAKRQPLFACPSTDHVQRPMIVAATA